MQRDQLLKDNNGNNMTTLKDQIKGPVYPILPAFRADEAFDAGATARYVEYLVLNEAGVLMVTAGTSRFNLLTDAEVRQLNQAVIDASGDALVIAANPMQGATSEAIRFAQEAGEWGADALLVYYPERYYGDDAVCAYFEAISQNSDIPLMIHANPMRHASGGNAYFSVELCRRLAEAGHIIGMKEEHGDATHRYKLGTHLGDEMVFIVAGGGMRTFVQCFLFGIQSYLVSMGSFVPKLEDEFYGALMSGDYDTALKVVRKFEEPFFDLTVPMGWHIALKGTLSLMDLMPIYERAPMRPISDEQLGQLRKLIAEFKWV